jgi:hypothetical protein
MRWWWGLPCSRPNTLSWILKVLAHWNNSPQVDMSLHHSDTLFWLGANQSLPLLLNAVCLFSGEATNTNFIVFGLTYLVLEPIVYHTHGEHFNHHTTNSVACLTSKWKSYHHNNKNNIKTTFILLIIILQM